MAITLTDLRNMVDDAGDELCRIERMQRAAYDLALLATHCLEAQPNCTNININAAILQERLDAFTATLSRPRRG